MAVTSVGHGKLLSPSGASPRLVNDTTPGARSLVPVVEPRLDNSTGTATNWFLFTDPALIDTLDYCYLEGQQGVYIETR